LDGLKYQLQFTTNLAPVNWKTLVNLTATTNVVSYADTNALTAAAQRFYRLILQP
jgi:hypothetical protein